jgi:hypothetical protein
MAFEKLTPESFITRMKEGKYKGLTGARRAIGKADWPGTKKATATDEAVKFYGTTKPSTAPAKKVQSTGGKAPKKAAKKVAVKSVGQAKKAAKGGRAPRSARSPQPVAGTEQLPAGVAFVQRDDPSAMRHTGASAVVAAFANRQLNPAEKHLYDLSIAEMSIHTSDEAKAACNGGQPKQASPFQHNTAGSAAPTPTIPTGLIPRVKIDVPSTTSSVNAPKSLEDLTTAEREQMTQLDKAARATGFDPHKQD